jgi:uncharacterized phage infection (PIP) family protein YhgE
MSGGTGRNATDEVRSTLQHAKDAVTDRAGQVREKATELKATLADKLETGADKIRQKSRDAGEQGGQAGQGAVAAGTQRIGQYGDAVATGMEKTAGWLRQGDLSDLGDAIVDEVQSHPARSLLIAVGIGYLIGRSLKD